MGECFRENFEDYAINHPDINLLYRLTHMQTNLDAIKSYLVAAEASNKSTDVTNCYEYIVVVLKHFTGQVNRNPNFVVPLLSDGALSWAYVVTKSGQFPNASVATNSK